VNPGSTNQGEPMAAQTWEVRVRGAIPPRVLAELGACGLTEEPAQTIMRTEPLDQAGLHGVLQRIRNLGLELLEIRSAPDIVAPTPE
jgi:hypothetical protein